MTRIGGFRIKQSQMEKLTNIAPIRYSHVIENGETVLFAEFIFAGQDWDNEGAVYKFKRRPAV